MAHLLRCQPSTLEQLKGIVEDFAVNMSEDDVRKIDEEEERSVTCNLCVQ